MIIDTHCHLDFDWFDDDRDDVLKRAAAASVEKIIVPSLDLVNGALVLELTTRYDSVLAAVGVHPNSSAEWREEWADEIKIQALGEKVVAIGEIGLDFFRDRSPKAVQFQAFEAQLNVAKDMGLPVIIHNREADEEIIKSVKRSPLAGSERAGVFHSFLTEWNVAKAAVDLGFYIGFTGPITYKNADAIREVVRKVPDDRILVETDAPFLTPQAKRGGRNEPAFVTYVVEKISEILGKPFEDVARITSQNAINLFGAKLGQS